ncbi:MAG: hypothetical protein AAF433_15265 [Bacteroidota bacterium]
MTTTEQIQNLNDTELLQLYRAFSQHLMQEVSLTPMNMKDNLAPDLVVLPALQGFQQADASLVMSSVDTKESVVIAKAVLLQFANHPEYGPMLAEFNANYINREMFAGSTILALGGVITMIIAATSTKIERKDGETNWSYDTANISSNAVELIKSLLSLIPDAVIKLEGPSAKEKTN